MSYILEALRKSDQQRQRGTTPTLQVAQLTVVARSAHVVYGCLHWHCCHRDHGRDHIAGCVPAAQSMPVRSNLWRSSKSADDFARPRHAAPYHHRKHPAREPAVRGRPLRIGAAIQAAAVAAEPVAEHLSGTSRRRAQDNQAISMEDWPAHIRQEIPAMEVQLHAIRRAGRATRRINSIRLREGGC